MKKVIHCRTILIKIILLIVLLGTAMDDWAQNSVLINFGSNTCSVSTEPSFTLIKDPFGSPVLLSNCNMQSQLPDFFSVFVAYNPANNKVYIADVRTGTETKIWILDIGLPQGIDCPISIPTDPTYSYSYATNNFEFDNNGDIWSFSNYDPATGQCNLDKFDVTNGTVINSRILQFPAGLSPNTISSGDLCILPNGRMFATLGYFPSFLYEITNYNTSSNATANFLTTMPNPCFGIAYIKGVLEITGTDFNQSCYYYDYDLSTGVLGSEKTFQVGNSPIDNTSFTPAIGNTKRLINATSINSNTYNLTYEIYVENMGNVILNNVELTDDLGAVFGAANVSNVSTSFVAGANAAGLTLNSNYNGTTDISILNQAQNLPNHISNNTNYFFKVLVQCTVTNIQEGITYLNSALTKGDIGSNNNISLVTVSDSSNNGSYTAMDPNLDGNANQLSENIPTPFLISALPVTFINLSAKLLDNSNSNVRWEVATPMINAKSFEIEFSSNGRSWNTIGSINITDNNKGIYDFTHLSIPLGNLYYRIKQIDIDHSFIYSKIVLLHNTTQGNNYSIYPTPSNNYFTIHATNVINKNTTAVLYDAIGRQIFTKQLVNSITQVETSQLPAGTYILKITDQEQSITQKLVVQHP